ncbi:MAG: protein phosphatase 2C domain-containing protein [Pirellulales bacterium]|nr:protein phosphatase 2C domain-containing protein [Pirellulales bacterium]
MWRHIAQSLQGPSHLQDNTPCQDAHSIRFLSDCHHPALVACVADGAGSAKHSDVGSAIACTTILEHAARYLESNGVNALQAEDVLLWCDDIRDRIKLKSKEYLCGVRDFATTLCTAIISADYAAFFQIGDGAIVLGNDQIYGVVFWPQRGEYANSTNFLTADEYHQQLQFISIAGRYSKVALMTDGLERLALRFDSQTPHVPFFDPLFRALESASDVERLSESLRDFLCSDSIHHRTDDDKTLVLATQCTDDAA